MVLLARSCESFSPSTTDTEFICFSKNGQGFDNGVKGEVWETKACYAVIALTFESWMQAYEFYVGFVLLASSIGLAGWEGETVIRVRASGIQVIESSPVIEDDRFWSLDLQNTYGRKVPSGRRHRFRCGL
jgi:hypothetical protein